MAILISNIAKLEIKLAKFDLAKFDLNFSYSCIGHSYVKWNMAILISNIAKLESKLAKFDFTFLILVLGIAMPK